MLCVGSVYLSKIVQQNLGRGLSTTAHQQSHAAALKGTDLTGASQERIVRSFVICHYIKAIEKYVLLKTKSHE